jgi:outer membrane protein assembly factor BamB
MNVVWTAELAHHPRQAPVVAGECVVLAGQPLEGGRHTTLFGLDLHDGRIRWRQRFDYEFVSGLSVAMAAGEPLILVALTSNDLLRGEGRLLALDVHGRERWRWTQGGQAVSAPTIAAGQAVFTAETHALVLLDLETGAEQRRIELPPRAAVTAPAVAGGAAYVPYNLARLAAVGLDGAPRWTFNYPGLGWLAETPLLFDELVVAVSSDGRLLAIDRAGGVLRWERAVGPPGRPLSPPATDGARLFVGARDGLHAFNLADGAPLWQCVTDQKVTAVPVAHAGLVYVGCRDAHLYALDAADGAIFWEATLAAELKVAPLLAIHGETPLLLAADHAGWVAALERPLSTQERAARGDSAALIALGELARAAELLEEQGDALHAAQLWRRLKDHARAAPLFEAAEAWLDAALAWAELGRFRKRAEALAGHARALAGDGAAGDGAAGDGAADAEAQARAWESAAAAFDEVGATADAAACRHKVAECRRRPLITVDAQTIGPGLTLNAWAQIQFRVHNEGFGVARHVVIRRARGEQFAGEVIDTQQIFTLRPGRTRASLLDVRPLAFGPAVPLRLRIEYVDEQETPCVREQTIHLPVAEHARDTQQWRRSDIFDSSVRAEGAHAYLRAPELERDLPELQRKLQVYFSRDELHDLCQALGVDYAEWEGLTRSRLVRDLVMRLHRHGRLPELIVRCKEARPHVDW